MKQLYLIFFFSFMLISCQQEKDFNPLGDRDDEVSVDSTDDDIISNTGPSTSATPYDLDASETTYDFGSLVNGTKVQKTITFQNTGTEELSLCITPRLQGTNSDEMTISSDSCSTNDLQSGDSCDITVETNSISLGDKEAELVWICDNDGVTVNFTFKAIQALVDCPDSYIAVAADATVGVNNDFCVMKFEAKNNGASVAVSQASGTPWVNIDVGDAYTECEDLNTVNGVTNKYGLISNAEWMAIARSIEGNTNNWFLNYINRGHSDNSPSMALSVSDENNPYDQTGNSSLQINAYGKEQKRTHILGTGEVIWDFAGNVSEHLEWVTSSGLSLIEDGTQAHTNNGTGNATFGFKEWDDVDQRITGGDLMPVETWQASTTTLNSTNGIGMYYPKSSINADKTISGGVQLRGGDFSEAEASGIYSLNLQTHSQSTSSRTGFRCVFRP